MESPVSNPLPIILVSAKDQDSAQDLISKINDNEIEIIINNENNSKLCWRILNKYYTADVQFHILPDGGELSAEIEDLVEGHIIYLTEDEALDNTANDVMEKRVREGNPADVRVVVTDCEFEDEVLAASAASCHYELIPLRALEDPEAAEPIGLERIRAAFHAHVWSGMQTHHPPSVAAALGRDDSDSDSWSSWQGPDGGEDETEEQWVERAEAFAAALGSLPEAVAGVRAANDNRTVRIARAELVIAAFCEALGDPLHLEEERLNQEL